MPLPRRIARLNRRGLNRVVVRAAPVLPGFGVLEHRGRRSGRAHRVPVNVFHRGGRVRIALTYGAGSDWVRNVLAAGGCRLLTRGRVLELTAPRVVRDPERAGLPGPVRAVLGLLGVEEFLDLDVVAG
ncbi:nitroreductase family deazaflavin-dependent oxidoreductase [Kineococcus sp. SYSU DK006]|uniref:nitroreductase family deazaflavin-dependent oxidoreductase n=1 Tax=Kineococcus sp. SYSU DK006 TaxID=3383127 RepID=UPI003D7CC8A0